MKIQIQTGKLVGQIELLPGITYFTRYTDKDDYSFMICWLSWYIDIEIIKNK